ncbi:MAG: YciI family protein, partial [Polyangiaceae bacterium]
MRFMMIVKGDEKSEAGILPDEKLLSAMGAYNDELIRAGVMVGGEGLHPSSKGWRIERKKGALKVMDGPFAESKELIAGYWILDVASREEAVAWAKKVPCIEGDLEVRQIVELDDFPVHPSEKPDGWRAQEQRFRDSVNPKSPKFAPPKRIPGTTRYLVIHLSNPQAEASLTLPDPQAMNDMFEAMWNILQERADHGALLGCDGLHPSSNGFRVRAKGTSRTIIDGPFAESKELVAGFSMIQAKTKDEAIAFAKRCCLPEFTDPTFDGVIEIRQLHETEEFPVDPAEKKDGWRAKELAFRDRTQGK